MAYWTGRCLAVHADSFGDFQDAGKSLRVLSLKVHKVLEVIEAFFSDCVVSLTLLLNALSSVIAIGIHIVKVLLY